VGLPLPVPNLVISVELQDIAEMLEDEAAHQAELIETELRMNTSAGEFLCYCIFCDVMSPILLILMLVTQVFMMLGVPTLPFVRWSMDS
jgi:hypothetical protein